MIKVEKINNHEDYKPNRRKPNDISVLKVTVINFFVMVKLVYSKVTTNV